MGKLLIGLDISLNSTGVCFRDTKNGTISYLNIISRYKFSVGKEFDYDKIIRDNPYMEKLIKLKCVDIKMIDRKPIPAVESIGLSQWHRLHMVSTINLGNYIANEIYKKIIELGYKSDDVYLCIENYAHSMGDQFIQLIENTHKIKSALIEHFKIKIENIYIIPGPTIKKFVGNGGYVKSDFFDKFIINSKDDEDLKDDEFRLELYDNQNNYYKFGTKNKEVVRLILSPVDDLIDAYYLNAYLKDVFLQI